MCKEPQATGVFYWVKVFGEGVFVIQFASVQIGRQTQLSLVDGCPAQVPVTDMRPLRGRRGKCLFQMLEVLISVDCHLFYF